MSKSFKVSYRATMTGEAIVWADNAVEAETKVRRGEFFRARDREEQEHISVETAVEIPEETPVA